MKKIGFIDNFLSEFHANTYVDKLRKKEKFKKLDMEICYAYANTEISPYDNVTTDEWCAKNNVKRLNTLEEIVEQSDYLVVLSPDNPELHEQLTELALKSGKPTYIDKTFAISKESAERIFSLAKQYHTPVYSSSALRFAKELDLFRKTNSKPKSVICIGPYLFEIYAIHILEMIFTVMKPGVKRIMAINNTMNRSIVLDYGDRKAMFCQLDGTNVDFQIAVEKYDKTNSFYKISDDYFDRFLDAMIVFFDTRIPQVDANETIELVSILENAKFALSNPFVWVEI